SIDKSQKIAIIEIPKAMDLVDSSNGCTEPFHDLHCHFETQIHTFRANMKQQIAGRGNSMPAASMNFSKGMEFRRARHAEQLFPCLGSDAHHTGKTSFDITEVNCSYQSGEVGAQGADGIKIVSSGINFHDEKNRCSRQWRGDCLRYDLEWSCGIRR